MQRISLQYNCVYKCTTVIVKLVCDVICLVYYSTYKFLQQERDLGDEYGWKQVHGDVFRSASYPLLFSSLVGTGYQLAVVGFLVIIMSIVGDLYTEYVAISKYLTVLLQLP